jgi:hypothetical protein
MDGEWYTATYSTSSPLLRGVEILQRNRVTEGVRRPRRAKLTDLLSADPNKYLVDEHTKEAALVQAEKEERRRLARLGLQGKKGKKKTELRSAAGGKKDIASAASVAAPGGAVKKGVVAAPAAKATAAPAKPAAAAAKK